MNSSFKGYGGNYRYVICDLLATNQKFLTSISLSDGDFFTIFILRSKDKKQYNTTENFMSFNNMVIFVEACSYLAINFKK